MAAGFHGSQASWLAWPRPRITGLSTPCPQHTTTARH